MKVKRLRYYGGSTFPFLGDYAIEDYDVVCKCGNDTKFTEKPKEMSIVQTYICEDCGKEHDA